MNYRLSLLTFVVFLSALVARVSLASPYGVEHTGSCSVAELADGCYIDTNITDYCACPSPAPDFVRRAHLDARPASCVIKVDDVSVCKAHTTVGACVEIAKLFGTKPKFVRACR